MERLMSEDPDDRDIREAHGFTYEDDWRDRTLLCRNGCGTSYYDVISGKIRKCLMAPGDGDAQTVRSQWLPSARSQS